MNILKIFNTETLKKNLSNISARFPITIAIILLTATLFFVEVHYHSDISDVLNENIFISILSLILTFVFSIGVYLSTENNDFSKTKKNIFQLIPIIFGILFFFTFTSDVNNIENFIFFLLTLTGIISYLFFAPYIKNLDKKQSVFYTYFYNISVVILITFIFGGVLFGLGAIGIGAVDALFDIDINESLTYGNWAILSMSIIAPLFTLTQIPEKSSFKENHFNENLFFSFLTKFVAIPFITIYFLILYAYSIKVLMNFGDWPKGEVSWMVIGFSVFGYITYIFSYIFENTNSFIKKFRKVFPFIVIPQIFMLFYAIYLRINQYDITINRYFVVVFGLWLLVISLYYIFSKKKYLSAIPVVLTLFTILISVGPWSVYSLPESRQADRLETKLTEANIIKDGKIIPLKNINDINKELSNEIYSGINYLCDFDSCKKIKNIFPKIYEEIVINDKIEWTKRTQDEIKRLEDDKRPNGFYGKEKDRKEYIEKRLKELKKETYSEPSKWEIVSKITEKIKVKNNYSYKNDSNKKHFNFSKDYKQNIFPINIEGYSTIYRLQNFDKWDTNKNYAEYNAIKEEIIIRKNGTEIEKVSTKEISKKIITKFGKTDSRKLNTEDLTFEIEQNGKKYKLIFENISIKNPDYKRVNENEDDNENNTHSYLVGNYTNGYILVK